MNVCFYAGNQTSQLFSYLERNFRDELILSVLFPQEAVPEDADIVIFEEPVSAMITKLLDLEVSPLIVILGEGSSDNHIHYLSDFYNEFPKLLKSRTPKDPSITISKKSQKFIYRQEDIVATTEEAGLTIYLKSGKKIIQKTGFRKLYDQLSPELFFLISKNCVANILYVSQMKSDVVVMENGLRLPIPADQKEAVENRFYKTKFFKNFSNPKKSKATTSKRKKQKN